MVATALDRSKLADRTRGGWMHGPSSSRLQPETVNLDWSTFRSMSRALDRYHRADFSDVPRLLRLVFGPETSDEMVPHPLALVQSFAVQYADAFALPPERKFSGSLSEAQAGSLATWYEILGVNSLMLLTHELLVTQRTALGVMLPTSDGRGLTAQVFRPWEVEVIPDPRTPSSLSRAKEVRVRMLVATNGESASFAPLVMNREFIYLDAGGERVPVWTTDGRNPFPDGRLPVWYGRLGDPQDGMFFAPLPHELLAAQDALILSQTDIDLIARFQSYGQRWMAGRFDTAPEFLKSGPAGIWKLPEGATLGISQPAATLEQYLKAVEGYLRLVAQLGGLNWEGLSKGYQSTLARQMGLADRQLYRLRHRQALRDCEARFLRTLLMCLAYMSQTGPVYPEDTRVDVAFTDVPLPADPQAEAQALQARVELGVDSPVDAIARERRISREDAERVWERNMAERDRAKASASARVTA